MIFSGVTPSAVKIWVDEHKYGKDDDYVKGKADTQEAINKLLKMPSFSSATYSSIRNWFDNELLMCSGTYSSYRAFITLSSTDEILNLRISNHYSKEHNTRRAFAAKGTPDSEYHVNVEPATPSVSGHITNSTVFQGVLIIVCDYDVSEFEDDTKRDDIINELVDYLTYGTGITGFSLISTASTKPVSEQIIRLTEQDLYEIIRESINIIMKEII